MTAASDHPPDRLALTYTEEEVWAFARLMQARRDRGPAWDLWWSVIFAMILAVGFAPYVALWLEWIHPVSFEPVLTTAYAAFVAGGLTYAIVMLLRTRSQARAVHREGGSKHWTFTFDETGFACTNEQVETRVPWRAVQSVENTGTMVLIWLNAVHATHLPARVFAGAGARAAFVASVAARIKAARGGASD